jgi:CheY-like chemotaxis protein
MDSAERLILLAEDDQDFTVLLEAALEEGRIFSRMEVAADGESARNYLAGKGSYQDRSRYPLPCLLIIDLLLPRVNGFEVLEWVRSQPRFDELPVVVLTGLERQGESQRAYALGADGFYVKPFHFHQLTALLKEIFETWSRGRHVEHAMAGLHR